MSVAHDVHEAPSGRAQPQWLSWSTAFTESPTPDPAPPVSEQALAELAQTDPERLITLIDTKQLEPSLLTFAAEALGQVGAYHRPRAIRVLTSLFRHDRAVVREGAVYGLGAIAEFAPTVRDCIKPLLNEDREPSPGVRQAVQDVLDDDER